MATEGRAGAPSARSSAANSPAISGPATAGMRWAIASVEAWARWAQEKASFT